MKVNWLNIVIIVMFALGVGWLLDSALAFTSFVAGAALMASHITYE